MDLDQSIVIYRVIRIQYRADHNIEPGRTVGVCRFSTDDLAFYKSAALNINIALSITFVHSKTSKSVQFLFLKNIGL